MKKENLVVILIIVHKQFPTENEKKSLLQCFKILGKHSIKLLCHRSLNVGEYKKVNSNVEIDFIDEKWLGTYEMFNKLKISSFLYKKYEKYQFILFYELDAWVFRNDLQNWCKRGFDYIGAPWTGTHLYKDKPIVGVGNGGFSLRNVKSSIKLLKKLQTVEILENYEDYNWYSILVRLPIIFKKILLDNSPSRFERNFSFQEDLFWCVIAPNRLASFHGRSLIIRLLAKCFLMQEFKIASADVAAKFSFETTPAHFYNLNNKNLPFGCHAWEKYDPEFWTPFIPGNFSN